MGEAKQTDLVIRESAVNEARELIAKYKGEGALIFVAPESISTQALFVPEITCLKVTEDDFHSRQINGRLMPKAHHVDRMAAAAGISFIEHNCGTRKEGPDTWVGRAQGKIRLPDGSWRESSPQEYEFDTEVRSQETFLKAKAKGEKKYDSEVNRQLHIVELKKAARARASTGARLRVVRELTGTPIAFEPKQIKQAMVFGRVSVNSDLLLADPQMAAAAVRHALGATEDIYGTKDDASEPREALPAPDADTIEGSAETIVDDVPFGDDEVETPTAMYRRRLAKYVADADGLWRLSDDAQDAIAGLLEDEESTVDALKALHDKIGDYLTANKRTPMADEGGAS